MVFRLPYARVVKHDKCKGKAHLEEELERVEDLGGEGLMIREPRSKYVNGRSHTLLKIKTFHDAEVSKRCMNLTLRRLKRGH